VPGRGLDLLSPKSRKSIGELVSRLVGGEKLSCRASNFHSFFDSKSCVAGFPARPLLLDLNAAKACGDLLILGDRVSSLPKSTPPISVNNFTYNEVQISCEN
jgi:hypothetical protein